MKKIFGYLLAAAALTPMLASCSDYLEVTDESLSLARQLPDQPEAC